MINKKIKKISELKKLVAELKSKGEKIVFTNGCFDILHLGHILYLEKSKSKGDKLIVAINNDESVRKLKGNSRPITSESGRAILIAALETVDYVIIFNGLTPLELIKTLKPDILTKGGDWKTKDIVGADVVQSYGGKIISIPYIEGYSTSSIISKIQRVNLR